MTRCCSHFLVSGENYSTVSFSNLILTHDRDSEPAEAYLQPSTNLSFTARFQFAGYNSYDVTATGHAFHCTDSIPSRGKLFLFSRASKLGLGPPNAL